MNRRTSALLVFVIAAFGAQTATASATDYFVDAGTGADTNTCLSATAPAPNGPCLTIDHALDLAQANTGPDEVLVADGTYAESLLVGDGTTLVSLEPADPKPVIDNGAAIATAVTIPGTGGSVQGFEIRSGFEPVRVNGPGAVTENEFPTTTPPANLRDVAVLAVAGAVQISGNDFSDDGIGTNHFGIFSNATSATNLTIQGNSFSNLHSGVWLQDGNSSPLIADNDFDGLHESNGSGVLVYEGTPVIRHNTISAPGSGTPTGISLNDTNGIAGATMSRNTIVGMTNGLSVVDDVVEAPTSVTMNGDVIVGSGNRGVHAANTADGVSITATNVTLFDNIDADLYVQDGSLTLDSSIVDDLATGASDTTCAISFSRGFAIGGPPADDCDDFQSTADPMFVGSGNYHLQAGSPMIDAGNPLAPAAGVFDIDGDARALSAAPTCPGRRDIGADEFVPASPGPAVCPAEAVPPVPQPQPKKKCKKGRKLKKGKCVKKKRKKGKR